MKWVFFLFLCVCHVLLTYGQTVTQIPQWVVRDGNIFGYQNTPTDPQYYDLDRWVVYESGLKQSLVFEIVYSEVIITDVYVQAGNVHGLFFTNSSLDFVCDAVDITFETQPVRHRA